MQAFIDPIRESLLCVAKQVHLGTIAAIAEYPAGSRTLVFIGKPQLSLNKTPFLLHLQHTFSLVALAHAQFGVRSEGYMYRIDRPATGSGHEELISYHWHPRTKGPTFPHMHVNVHSDPDLNRRMHFPTGRMSIEHLLLFVIREFDVHPLRARWEDTIQGNIEMFEKCRTWA